MSGFQVRKSDFRAKKRQQLLNFSSKIAIVVDAVGFRTPTATTLANVNQPRFQGYFAPVKDVCEDDLSNHKDTYAMMLVVDRLGAPVQPAGIIMRSQHQMPILLTNKHEKVFLI